MLLTFSELAWKTREHDSTPEAARVGVSVHSYRIVLLHRTMKGETAADTVAFWLSSALVRIL